MTITTANAKVDRKGSVAIRLRVVASERTGCTGTLTVKTAARVKGRVIKLGMGAFAMKAGATTVTVKVSLSPTGLKLLRARKKLKAAAAVTARDTAGRTISAKRTITLVARARTHGREGSARSPS